MYCKDCKYFLEDLEEEIIQGECRNRKIDYTYKITNDDEVSYMDGENYSARLIVGGKFGCIHFEKKDRLRIV